MGKDDFTFKMLLYLELQCFAESGSDLGQACGQHAECRRGGSHHHHGPSRFSDPGEYGDMYSSLYLDSHKLELVQKFYCYKATTLILWYVRFYLGNKFSN